MTKEDLKQFLQDVDKKEIIDLYIAELEQKKEVEADLKLLGNSIISILENIGVMQNREIVVTQSKLINAVTKLGQQIMFGKFTGFEKLKDLPPLLIKYKHLLEDGN